MNIDNKLDEDFLFYLSFTGGYYNRIQPETDVEKCQQWLKKLCGGNYTTREQKRNRNIFLSNLVLCMQNGKLEEPFTYPPHEVDVLECVKYFGDPQVELEDQDWLQHPPDSYDDKAGDRDDGRTYVATRAMPSGQGAMAYIAVTLGDTEPKWLGGGEGVFDQVMAQKYQEMVPEQTEMEKILARRKDPRERRKVVTFYEGVVKNINEELDENIDANQNETVSILLEQLVNNLKQKGQYEQYEQMPEKNRRQELLLQLFSQCKSRISQINKREEVLDEISDKVLPKSFFDTPFQIEEKYELPAIMWQEAISKAPSKKNQEKLYETYPKFVIDRFLPLLANIKEEIAVLLHKRHERIITQMRKELRKEGQHGQKAVATSIKTAEHAEMIMKEVLKARKFMLESKEKFDEERKRASKTKRSAAYEEMRKTVVAMQEDVEAEATRGWVLSEEINRAVEQNEYTREVNENQLINMEEANMKIMKNIKRLRAAVKTYEGTVKHLQDMIKSSTTGAQNQFFF